MTNEADSSSGHHAREEEKERSYKNSRLYGKEVSVLERCCVSPTTLSFLIRIDTVFFLIAAQQERNRHACMHSP